MIDKGNGMEIMQIENLKAIFFKKISLEEKELFDTYFKKLQSRSCNASFANVYLWSRYYRVEYAIILDMLVFTHHGNDGAYSFPIGDGDVKKVIDFLMEDCKENNVPFRLYSVTKEQFEQLEELYPGKFEIEYNRDDADYVYEVSKMIALKGKNYRAKRNHINRFKENNEWVYEEITEENLIECLEMANQWRVENECDKDPDKSAEMCVTLRALRERDQIGLIGGLIRANGKVVAITLGEPLTEDTFVIHIEKAFAGVQGAYPMINREFLEHYVKDFTYVNREEDVGAPGLRKAKMSYRPVFFVERGNVKLKSEE